MDVSITTTLWNEKEKRKYASRSWLWEQGDKQMDIYAILMHPQVNISIIATYVTFVY